MQVNNKQLEGLATSHAVLEDVPTLLTCMPPSEKLRIMWMGGGKTGFSTSEVVQPTWPLAEMNLANLRWLKLDRVSSGDAWALVLEVLHDKHV